MNEKLVAKTLVLYLLKLYLLFKLLSLACLVFKFVVLCCSGGCQLSFPVSTVTHSGCWMEITSRNKSWKDGDQCLSPVRGCDRLGEEGLSKMKLPRWLPWGVRSSTPPGGNALICAVDVAMSAESVWCRCRATKAPVASETQLIMCCSKVIYNGPLVLSWFSTPQAVCVSR